MKRWMPFRGKRGARPRRPIAAGLIFGLVLGGLVSAAPAPPRNWKEQAAAIGLGSAQIDRLETQGVLVVDEGLRQVHEVLHPWWGNPEQAKRREALREVGILFTTDMLVAAAHANLDENFRQAEAVQVLRFRAWLGKLWNGLPDSRVELSTPADRLLFDEALRHARFVLAVPLTLLGQAPQIDDAELAKLVAAEVAVIREGQAIVRPSWASSARELDYRRMQPLAMYLGSPVLEGLFRAREWLAQPLLDPASERDVAAWYLLAALESRRAPYVAAPFLWTQWQDPFVVPEGGGIRDVRFGSNSGGLGKLGAGPLREIVTRIQRAISSAPAAARESRSDWPGLATPVLESPPSIVSALLGSPSHGLPALNATVAFHFGADAAVRGLTSAQRGELSPLPPSLDRWTGAASTLDALRALVGPPDRDAPAVFRSELWQRKSLQTAMAGWAMLTPDRPMHANVTCCVGSEGGRAFRYIEPNPAAWGRLAEAFEGPTDGPSPEEATWALAMDQAVEARWWADLLGRNGTADLADEYLNEVRDLEAWREHAGLGLLEQSEPPLVARKTWSADPGQPLARGTSETRNALEDERVRGFRPLIAALRHYAASLEAGRTADAGSPPFAKTNERYPAIGSQVRQWCGRFETLAHKQLRGLPFDERDLSFMREVSSELSLVFFDYGMNEFLHRDDTAPRVSLVRDPANPARVIHVGTGPPAVVYVVCPIEGRPTLLRGAVLTYGSLEADHALTTQEWRDALERDPAAARPAFLAPLFGK